MDVDDTLLSVSVSVSINPNYFPAKLWSLVNNPTSRAIRWDCSGEGVIVEQQLFEKQFLSPCLITSENTDLFKTNNFVSFVRQLNLYGFKKAVVNSDSTHNVICGTCSPEKGTQHHFHNPNFKRNHPELLVNLKRLTTSYKARQAAGIEVKRRPHRNNRFIASRDGDGRETVEKRGGSSFLGQTHHASPHPYHPNRPQSIEEYNRTPVPPHSWMMGRNMAPSPTIFTTDNGIPISIIHRYPGTASSPASVHIQQDLQGSANTGQNFNNITPQYAHYQPGFYSPVCQCYTPGSVASNKTGSGQQTALYSHHSYYQPVNISYPGNQNQDLQNGDNQEMPKCDINLDTVFEIVDELQSPPKICLVKVATPEKQVSEPSTIVHSSMLPVSSQCDNYVNTIKANPPTPCGLVVIAASVDGEPVKGKHQAVSVPEKMPLMRSQCVDSAAM